MSIARALAVVALSAAAVAIPTAAHAAPERHVIEGQHLKVVSTLDHAAAGNLIPGQQIGWALEISADAPDSGQVDISMEGHGALAVRVSVSHCDVPWQDGICAAGERLLHPAAPAPLDGSRVHLVTTDTETAAHLHLLIEAPEALPGAAATDIHVIAEGFGEAVQVPSDPGGSSGPGTRGDLAVTGAESPGPLLLGALALIGGGTAALLARGRRRAGGGP